MTNDGRAIFANLTEAKDLERAVRKLKPAELTEVAVYLGTLGGGTVAATIFGHVRQRLETIAQPSGKGGAKAWNEVCKRGAKRKARKN